MEIENKRGRHAGYILRTRGGMEHPLPKQMHLGLSSDRRVVSLSPWKGVSPGVRIFPTTGRQAPLHRGCWVAALVHEGAVGICKRGHRPYGGPGRWLHLLSDSGERRVLVPPPDHKDLPSGHWRYVLASPDREWLLAQWSGECEVPHAFFAPASGSAPRAVTGEEHWLDAPTSEAIGWVDERTALVHLPEGSCSHGVDEPGLYRIGIDGSRSLVLPLPRPASVRMWAPWCRAPAPCSEERD